MVNQDSTSRQLSSLRAEIQVLQQELMDYRMVMECYALNVIVTCAVVFFVFTKYQCRNELRYCVTRTAAHIWSCE